MPGVFCGPGEQYKVDTISGVWGLHWHPFPPRMLHAKPSKVLDSQARHSQFTVPRRRRVTARCCSQMLAKGHSYWPTLCSQPPPCNPTYPLAMAAAAALAYIGNHRAKSKGRYKKSQKAVFGTAQQDGLKDYSNDQKASEPAPIIKELLCFKTEPQPKKAPLPNPSLTSYSLAITVTCKHIIPTACLIEKNSYYIGAWVSHFAHSQGNAINYYYICQLCKQLKQPC